MFDLKDKFDESDHLAIRATRVVTDKIGDLIGMIPSLKIELFISHC